MNRRRLLPAVVLVTAGLLATIYAFLVHPLVFPSKADPGERLREIDHDLSLGYYDSAVAGLVDLSRLPQSELGYLRILKRLYRIGSARGDLHTVWEVSERALSKIPGSQALRAVHVHTTLRTGFDQAPKLEPSPPRRYSGVPETRLALSAVLAELSLGSDSPSMATHPLLAMARDPTATELEAAAERYASEMLYRDAALLRAAEGDIASAARMAREDLVGKDQDEVAGFLLYDAGQWEPSLERIVSAGAVAPDRTDLLMVIADLQLLTGAADEAEVLYSRVVRAEPRLSWKPYIALAGLMYRRGDGNGARAILTAARTRFRDESRIGIAYSRILWEQGRHGKAEEILGEVIEADPASTEARLLQVQWLGVEGGTAGIEARLWNLHGRDQSNEAVTRELVRRLIGWGELDSALYALGLFDAAAGNSGRPWLYLYRGVISALLRDKDAALAQLSLCVDADDTWYHRYNRAVVYTAYSMFDAAGDDLRACELLPEAGRSNPQSAEIRALLAETRMMSGDLEGARNQAAYALDLDPDNLRARLVQRNLADPAEK